MFQSLVSSHAETQLYWIGVQAASKDSNMETLVRKYPCHIATSASVLQQLLDNHPPDFSMAWDIPVVIRDYGTGSGMSFTISKTGWSSHINVCKVKVT